MTTALELAEQGVVHETTFNLKPGQVQWRMLYLTPEARKWVEDLCRDNPSTTWDADLTPKEQAYMIMLKFVIGGELNFDTEFHVLRPGEDAIWELKTPDLRLFGFFSKHNSLIVVSIDFATKIKHHSLYSYYMDRVRSFREKYDVDCVWRVGEHDVLSIRAR